DKGTPIDNVSHYDSGTESVLSVESMSGLSDSPLLFVTKHGFVKLVDGAEFQVAKRTVAASKLSENDELLLVSKVSGTEHVVLQSEGGYFLRFPLSEIPAKKKTAIGVRGMKLGDKDSLQAAYVLTDSDVVVTYKERQVHINRLQISKRDNKGVKR
ncbi:MAG: DNA gyrase C-terminal beta-propeller domain-containing protein, partial [Lachnospiraceae bacterium]